MTTLTEAVQAVLNIELESLNTCLPGTFESYNFKEQKATVKPLLKTKFEDGAVADPNPIAEVPVVFPRTLNSGMTFPINKGDGCILLFTQRSLDLWLNNGGSVEPGDPRKFDATDAIAIPGLFSFKQRNIASNNDDLEIHHNNFKIVITKAGKIKIQTPNGIELIKVIDDWMSQIATTKVITGIGLQPFDPTSITAMQVIQAQLQELLA